MLNASRAFRLKHSLRAAAQSGCGCLFQSIERRSQQLHDMWKKIRLHKLITSGARSKERVYFYISEKSQYERPAGRPAVVTLFERFFLLNRMTNSRTVILIRCHHAGTGGYRYRSNTWLTRTMKPRTRRRRSCCDLRSTARGTGRG